MPPSTPKPPVGRHTGQPGKLGNIYTAIAEEAENVPELRHPESVVAFDRIAKSDHVAPLLRLLKGPIRNYNYRVDPGNTDPRTVAQAAHVLGFPMVGEQDGRRARARRGDTLNRALRAMTLGHAVFEIEGAKGPDGRWLLRDLHYLSPRSLWRWQFRGDSTDIEFVEQTTPTGVTKLDANRLAVVRYDLDPDHPYGESMLRPVYGPWLRRERYNGIALVAAERNGMGVPVVEAAENATDVHQEANERIATGVAAGEDTGYALPKGSTLKFVGVDGQTFPLLDHIQHEEQAVSKIFAGQILNLGTSQAGSRSVGDNHAELLWDARDAVVEWVCDQLATQVLHRVAVWAGHDPDDRDGLPSIEADRPEVVDQLAPDDWAALAAAGWVDPSDVVQRREFERRYSLPERTSPTPVAASADPITPKEMSTAIAQLVNQGVITPDETLQTHVREQLALPAADASTTSTGTPYGYDLLSNILTIDERRAQLGLPQLPNGLGKRFPNPELAREGEGGVVAASAATDTGLVAGVPQARRPLTAIEQASSWPFAALEAAWTSTRDELAALLAVTRRQMVTNSVTRLAGLPNLFERVDELHDLARTAAMDALTPEAVAAVAAATDRLASQAADLTRSAVAAQGLTTEATTQPGYAEQAARSARAAGQTVALTVADQVARSAARVAAPGVSSPQVAALVESDLSTLTDALPRQVAGAETTRAQHAGQTAVIETVWESPDIASAYYSSLLDGATCGPCARRDGHRYQDMTEVRSDFPSGGYRACEGNDRCRCTWVFVLDSEMPVTVDDTGSDI